MSWKERTFRKNAVATTRCGTDIGERGGSETRHKVRSFGQKVWRQSEPEVSTRHYWPTPESIWRGRNFMGRSMYSGARSETSYGAAMGRRKASEGMSGPTQKDEEGGRKSRGKGSSDPPSKRRA